MESGGCFHSNCPARQTDLLIECPLAIDLTQKRYELVREIFPGAARILSVQNLANAAIVKSREVAERAVQGLNLQVSVFDARRTEDFERAFNEAVKLRASVVVLGQDGLLQANSKYVVELSAKYRLPAVYPAGEYVDDGGLIGHGVSYPDLYRRAATYVDRILKGARAGDLPIEQATKFELVINLKTAKALGVSIPPSVLLRADRVIE